MALPVFNEGTMRYHDSETNLMMKTSVAESILSSNSFNAGSTALASKPTTALAVSDNALAPATMTPMESLMGIFMDMANSLSVIENGILSIVTQNELEERDANISDADVVDTDLSGRDDKPTNKKPGILRRSANKLSGLFSKEGLIKTGLIAGLTAIMAFADEVAELLQPILKFINERVWPNAVDVFTDFMEKGRKLFGSLSDKLSIIFGSSEGPHGVTLLERVIAFGGIFTDIGGFILDIGNSLITNVLEAFGVNFDPYDTAGEWLLGKLTKMWTGIKTWFEGVMPEWMPGFKDIGVWVVDKVTAAWKGIKDFFSAAVEVYKVDGISGLFAWVLDKVSTAFVTFYNWFSVDEALEYTIDGVKGLFSWLTGKVGAAWKIIKSWFGFNNDDETSEKVDLEKESESYNLFALAKGAANAIWDALTGIFSFSPTEIMANIKDDLANMGIFFKALAVGGFEALQAILPFGETPQDAFKRGFDSVMYGGLAGADVSIAPGMTLGERVSNLAGANEMAMQTGKIEGGFVINDNSYTNTSTTTSQDTYTATELGTDHQERTIKAAGDKTHLQNK